MRAGLQPCRQRDAVVRGVARQRGGGPRWCGVQPNSSPKSTATARHRGQREAAQQLAQEHCDAPLYPPARSGSAARLIAPSRCAVSPARNGSSARSAREQREAAPLPPARSGPAGRPRARPVRHGRRSPHLATERLLAHAPPPPCSLAHERLRASNHRAPAVQLVLAPPPRDPPALLVPDHRATAPSRAFSPGVLRARGRPLSQALTSKTSTAREPSPPLPATA